MVTSHVCWKCDPPLYFPTDYALYCHDYAVHPALPSGVWHGLDSQMLEVYRDPLRGTDYATFWERVTDRNSHHVAWESFFQSEDHTAFSPLTSRHGIENALLVMVVARLSKTPEGRKSLERLALKYLDSCKDIIESIQKASQSNWLTALNNQHIAAGICHRIGLLDDGSYLKIVDHYRAVFDKMFAADIISVVAGTLGSVSTLVQGSTYKTVSAAGESRTATEIGGLATVLKAFGKEPSLE